MFFLNEEAKCFPQNLCCKKMLPSHVVRSTEPMGLDKIAFHSPNTYLNSYNNFCHLRCIYCVSGLDIILLHLNFHNSSSFELSWFYQWSKSNSYRLICPNFYGLEEGELASDQVFSNFKACGLSFMPCFKPRAEPESQVSDSPRM